MDPRYQWPPQAYQNGRYIPPPPQQNGYPQQHGYPVQQPPQQVPQYQQQYQQYQQYSQPPQVQAQPRVVIPPQPRPNPHYGTPQDGMGGHARRMQPQIVIPPRPNISSSSSPLPGAMATPNPRLHQTHVPLPAPGPPQNQYRAPMPPQPMPQHRLSSSTMSAPQQSSPRLPHTPASQARHPQVVIRKSTPSSSLSQQRSSPTKALPTDLSVLLLQAADEYIDAARSMGSTAALAQRQADLEQYHKLMAMGMGCLEAVLKKFSHSPRDQAKLMLRLASLLIEETTNDIEIEELLSKGIALCSRNHLLDLKYSMQHLQARYQFTTNHRAALKSLDDAISEAETFKHIVWVYALRFLKVSLAMQVSGRPEMVSALQQLQAITKHAQKLGDRAIFVTASALEAMIHTRSAGPDHLEQAQRAIAAARSYQLEASSKGMGQITALIDSIDIACSLQLGKPDSAKVKALQERADKAPGPEDGVFSVLIEKSFGGQSLTQHTGGIFTKSIDGRDELVMSWLPRDHLKMMAYYLSGLTVVSQEPTKALAYLQEGHKITTDTLNRACSFTVSIPAAITHRSWVAVLDWHLRISLGLLAARLDDTTKLEEILSHLRRRIKLPLFKDAQPYTHLLTYLSGVHEQTTGRHEDAILTFMKLPLPTAGHAPADLKTNVSILAAINMFLILRHPHHPQHALLPDLNARLDPHLAHHPNAAFEAATRIIRMLAVSPTEPTINEQKTFTSRALQKAQELNNMQFITLCLCYMSSRFFANTVSEQAVKSVRAARSVAKQGRMVVWKAVAYGLCVRTFGCNGLARDAEDCARALAELEGVLPEKLVQDLGREVVKAERDVVMIDDD